VFGFGPVDLRLATGATDPCEAFNQVRDRLKAISTYDHVFLFMNVCRNLLNLAV
jgi:hypothetical protein